MVSPTFTKRFFFAMGKTSGFARKNIKIDFGFGVLSLSIKNRLVSLSKMCLGNKIPYDPLEHAKFLHVLQKIQLTETQEFVFDYKEYLSTQLFKEFMDDLQLVHNQNEEFDLRKGVFGDVATMDYEDLCELVEIKYCCSNSMKEMVTICKEQKLHHYYNLDKENRQIFGVMKDGVKQDAFVAEKLVYDNILYYKDLFTGKIITKARIRGTKLRPYFAEQIIDVGQYIDETGEIILDRW